MTQLKIASLTGLLMVGAIAAYASNEPSQSLPENALSQEQATEIVLAEHPGSVVEFESEYDDGIHVYEVYVRGTDGETSEIEMNALTTCSEISFRLFGLDNFELYCIRTKVRSL